MYGATLSPIELPNKRKQMSPGKRLQAMRELIGLSREDFGEIVGIGYNRLSSVENARVRMGVDEMEQVSEHFPEFKNWLAFEGEIDVEALKADQREMCQRIAKKLLSGEIPEGFYSDNSDS